MRPIQTIACCVALMLIAADAAAQARSEGAFTPGRSVFRRLFPASTRLPPPAASVAPPVLTSMRERSANHECAGCEERIGTTHFLLDSPRLTDTWLMHHAYQSNGGTFGDNEVIADFWYDAVHRRLFTRSLVLGEVDDPADLRLGRAPGVYPNGPDFSGTLGDGTTVGHVGFVRWSNNGFGSYFAAVQGAVRHGGTGYLDLATATGISGRTRGGSTYTPEELVKHVRLHPSGQLEIGYDTNPDDRPETTLLVRGNALIEGTLTVGSPAPAPVLACRVRTATSAGRDVRVSCDDAEIATGGGGACASGELRASRPMQDRETPRGWELTCSKSGEQTAYVICCTR